VRLIDFFDRSASLYPDHIFLRQGDVERSYGESARLIRRIGAALQRDTEQEGPVALLSPNDYRGVLALYGAMRAGRPIAPASDRNPLPDVAAYINAVAARTLFFHSKHLGAVEILLSDCPKLEQLVCLDSMSTRFPGLDDWMAPEDAPVRDVPAAPGDPWAYFGTSGTTGNPKVAIQTHLTALAVTVDMLFGLRLHDPAQHLVAAPVTHFAGSLLFALTAVGSTHILLPEAKVEQILDAIETERAEILFLPPTLVYLALDHLKTHPHDVGTLKALVYAGAPMVPARVTEAIGAFGDVLYNMYGQTEANGPIAVLRPEEHRPGVDERWDFRLRSVGRASLMRRVEIMGDKGTLVGPGQSGEVVMRSWGNCAGYLNNPEATADLFGHGWLHSGDIGIKDEGHYVALVDRKKDMIITGGFNVFSAEVEECLTEHPSILFAAVFGIPHAKWGEAVKAVVQIRDGEHISEAELIAYCKSRLGSVKSPKSIDFSDSLPRSPTGKILKKILRQPYWEGMERSI